MLSPAFRRAIQPACAACSSLAQAASRPAALVAVTATSQSLSRRPLHQRRHSSSKASSPPDEDAKVVPTPSGTATKDSDTAKTAVKKSSSRGGRKKAVTPSVNVPKVPPTTHLNPRDVHTSSWFAMHRPISVTTPWPPASTPESFNSLFEMKEDQYADTIHTLSDAVEALEAAGQFQLREDVDARDPMLQNVPFGGQTSGSATTAEIDQLLAQCVPFRPPPPPVALAEPGQKRKSAARKQDQESSPASTLEQRSWSVSFNFTTSSYFNGKQRVNLAVSDPQEIEVQEISLNRPSIDAQVTSVRQPYLSRLRAEHIRLLSNLRTNSKIRRMQLISVKRQRKLKMKKHKYKKLRNRTRALRKKLDK